MYLSKLIFYLQNQDAMENTATTYDDLLRNNHSTMLINNHTIAKLRLCASQNKMDDLEVYYSTLKNEYENVSIFEQKD